MQITKHVDKPHIISYHRDDGTRTWMKADSFFVRHDLSHYAIEKTLGYTMAFMGMLNDGMDIKDFEDREKRGKIAVTREARNAERMANLFLMEIAQGNFENFNQVLKDPCAGNREDDVPLLHSSELTEIRNYLRDLYQQWEKLSPGETMSLTISL